MTYTPRLSGQESGIDDPLQLIGQPPGQGPGEAALEVCTRNRPTLEVESNTLILQHRDMLFTSQQEIYFWSQVST